MPGSNHGSPDAVNLARMLGERDERREGRAQRNDYQQYARRCITSSAPFCYSLLRSRSGLYSSTTRPLILDAIGEPHQAAVAFEARRCSVPRTPHGSYRPPSSRLHVQGGVEEGEPGVLHGGRSKPSANE